MIKWKKNNKNSNKKCKEINKEFWLNKEFKLNNQDNNYYNKTSNLDKIK